MQDTDGPGAGEPPAATPGETGVLSCLACALFLCRFCAVALVVPVSWSTWPLLNFAVLDIGVLLLSPAPEGS